MQFTKLQETFYILPEKLKVHITSFSVPKTAPLTATSLSDKIHWVTHRGKKKNRAKGLGVRQVKLQKVVFKEREGL